MIGAVDINDEISHQTVMAAEMAISQTEHDDFGNRIQTRRVAWLDDAVEAADAAEMRIELRNRDIQGAGEGRVSRVAPVDVKLPHLDEIARRIVRAGIVDLVVAMAHE